MRERLSTILGDRGGPHTQRQRRGTSLVGSATNVVAGYGLAVVSQLLVFPVVGLDATLRQLVQIGALFTLLSLVRGYALRRLFERLGPRSFSSNKGG